MDCVEANGVLRGFPGENSRFPREIRNREGASEPILSYVNHSVFRGKTFSSSGAERDAHGRVFRKGSASKWSS
jgi:hypothetical protein